MFVHILEVCSRPRSPVSHSGTVLVLEAHEAGSSSTFVLILEDHSFSKPCSALGDRLVLEPHDIGSSSKFVLDKNLVT